MFLGRCAWLLLLASVPVGAATISLSGQSTVDVQTGDLLIFTVSVRGYIFNAGSFGAPPLPSKISFSLMTAVLESIPHFEAEFRSYDGSAVEPLGLAAFSTAAVSNYRYRGPASTLSGSATLTPDEAARLFAATETLLVLRNAGSDVTLGLSPFTLMQDLMVSFSGGSLSAGGIVTSAVLKQAEPAIAPAGLDGP